MDAEERARRNLSIQEDHSRGVGARTLAKKWGIARETVRDILDRQARADGLADAETVDTNDPPPLP